MDCGSPNPQNGIAADEARPKTKLDLKEIAKPQTCSVSSLNVSTDTPTQQNPASPGTDYHPAPFRFFIPLHMQSLTIPTHKHVTGNSHPPPNPTNIKSQVMIHHTLLLSVTVIGQTEPFLSVIIVLRDNDTSLSHKYDLQAIMAEDQTSTSAPKIKQTGPFATVYFASTSKHRLYRLNTIYNCKPTTLQDPPTQIYSQPNEKDQVGVNILPPRHKTLPTYTQAHGQVELDVGEQEKTCEGKNTHTENMRIPHTIPPPPTIL